MQSLKHGDISHLKLQLLCTNSKDQEAWSLQGTVSSQHCAAAAVIIIFPTGTTLIKQPMCHLLKYCSYIPPTLILYTYHVELIVASSLYTTLIHTYLIQYVEC